MTKRCVLFGGSGYIGTKLASHLVTAGLFDFVLLADLKKPADRLPATIEYKYCDVRQPISSDLMPSGVDCIINLAAIHREPGHDAEEYFQSNVDGARNICRFAEDSGCRIVCFISSIAVYGPVSGAHEGTTPCPSTPYGISKYVAEHVHEIWMKSGDGRKLIICRPGVIYGPGDPGNMLRMIKAIKRGLFVFPGSPDIKKSYGYVFGLVESVAFYLQREIDFVVYNYVERETEPLRGIASAIKSEMGYKAKTFRLPLKPTMAAAGLVYMASGGKSDIHPRRVQKVATPSHIEPKRLIADDFEFRYGFRASLRHWRGLAPGDF